MNAPLRLSGAIGAEGSGLAKQIFARFEELKSDRNGRSAELDAVARIYRPQRQGFGASGESATAGTCMSYSIPPRWSAPAT
ncbi:hypothetical protein MASR1M32_10510 [Rhodobacter sp.]